MMTKAMAAELGSSSLRVNGLAPGYFRTDLNEALTKNPAFSTGSSAELRSADGGKRMNSSALRSFWRRRRRALSQARSSTWTAE